ncbi:hypothetical protein GN956_G18296 [Arapaima gigas]
MGASDWTRPQLDMTPVGHAKRHTFPRRILTGYDRFTKMSSIHERQQELKDEMRSTSEGDLTSPDFIPSSTFAPQHFIS